MKKSQLKMLVKETIKEEKLNQTLKLSKKLISEAEEFCKNEYGIPIPTEKERQLERKKLYEEIIKESRNKPKMDSKILFKEVKNIISLLKNNYKETIV